MGEVPCSALAEGVASWLVEQALRCIISDACLLIEWCLVGSGVFQKDLLSYFAHIFKIKIDRSALKPFIFLDFRKRHRAWSNTREIHILDRGTLRKSARAKCVLKTTKKVRKPDGKVQFQGIKKALKSTQLETQWIAKHQGLLSHLRILALVF